MCHQISSTPLLDSPQSSDGTAEHSTNTTPHKYLISSQAKDRTVEYFSHFSHSTQLCTQQHTTLIYEEQPKCAHRPKWLTQEQKKPALFLLHPTFLIITSKESYSLFQQSTFQNIHQPCFIFTEFKSPSDGLCLDSLWSPRGEELLMSQNAGGNSQWSEALSFEFLRTMFACRLVALESQIEYKKQDSKKTDYSVTLQNPHHTEHQLTLGVSVTRASKYYYHLNVPVLLRKKLLQIRESTRAVKERQRWTKQVLHIFTNSLTIADQFRREWSRLACDLRSDTIVIVTYTRDEIECIF